jgi:U3 small nucleolar RNA-associated protein 10
VPYYAHVLDYLTATLVDTHSVLAQKKNRKAEADDEVASDDDDDDFFTRDDAPASKKTKMANGHASAVGEVTESVRETHALLLRTTVRALNGCFVHDSDGFMEKERFDVVMSPLVDVFDVVKYDASAKNFVYDVVTSCVANLAWAAKSDLLWKPLHYAVLMKSRSDSSAVRLATLKTVEKCYQVIGDEFLAMLPESIPFLAELMEDTDAEVERTCHQVIKQIEEISGESLDQYLTS